MVICAVLGCSNRSGCDKVLFFRIPKGRTTVCQRVRDLSRARHTGYLAALSREDLESKKKIDDARVCFQYFISGKPADFLDEINDARVYSRVFISGKLADLIDELNLNWLPTQNLGHRKTDPHNIARCEERYARK